MGIFNFFKSKKNKEAVSNNAEETLTKYAKDYIEKKEQAKNLFFKGLSSSSEKDYDSAIKFFTQSIALIDTVSSPYYNRAVAYYTKCLFFMAKKDFTTAIEIENKKYLSSGECDRGTINDSKFRIQEITPILELSNSFQDTFLKAYEEDGNDYFCMRFANVIQEDILKNNAELVQHFILHELYSLIKINNYEANMLVQNSNFHMANYIKDYDDYLDVVEENILASTMNAVVFFRAIFTCFKDDWDKILLIRVSILKYMLQNVDS